MKRQYSLTLLLVVFFIWVVNGQQNLSLSDAIQKALDNNLQIKIANQEIDIASRNNNWKTAGRTPIIDLNIINNHSFINQNNPASIIQDITNYTTGVTGSVDASYVLFDGYRVQFTKEQLQQIEVLSETNAQLAIENAIYATLIAYHNVLIQEAQLAVVTEVVNLSRDRIRYQDIRAEFGQSNRFDFLQSNDAYLNDSITLLVQENNIDIAFHNLNLAMGIDALDTRYILTDTLSQSLATYDFASLQNTLFNNNKNLRSLLVNRKLTDINSKIVASTKAPQIILNGGASANGNFFWQQGENPFTMQPFGSDFSRTFNVYGSVALRYNIYDGGSRDRNIENARVEEQIAELNIEEAKRQLNAQLLNTLSNFNHQKELYILADGLAKNARENITIAEERLKGGLINSFDYRAIQLAYISASQNRLFALYNLKVTELEIQRLIGNITR